MEVIEPMKKSTGLKCFLLFLFLSFFFSPKLFATSDISLEIEYRNGYLLTRIFNHTSKKIASRYFDVSVSPLIILINENNRLIQDRNWSKPVPASKLHLSCAALKVIFIEGGKERIIHTPIDECKRFKLDADGSYYLIAFIKKGYSIADGVLRSDCLELTVKNTEIVSSRTLSRDEIPEFQQNIIEATVKKMLDQES